MATPTPLDAKARGKALEKIAKYGRTVVVRSPISVEVESGPEAGSVLRSPYTDDLTITGGDIPIDSGDLTLIGPSGLLQAGDVLEIDAAGHEGIEYTIGSPSSTIDPIIGAVVEITPLTVAEVPDESDVTVLRHGADHVLKALVLDADMKLIEGGIAQGGDIVLMFATKAIDDAGFVLANENDLYLGDDPGTEETPGTSARAEIIAILPISSGEQDFITRVVARRVS